MKFVIGIVVLVAAFGLYSVGVRNGLVTQRNQVQNAWAQVDVVLQRRADLIPNLVETVKGFAAQEKSILTDLANARASMAGARTPAERINANSQLEGALGRLLVVVENYPQLKSNENFLRLQDELAGTENRIAVERRKYNETVTAYNTKLELFPGNLVASLFGFQRDNAYFTTEPAKREVPAVKF
jgi:LemA protein